MAVTFPAPLGGNGNTYDNASFLNNGHETNFLTVCDQVVKMAESAATNAVTVASNTGIVVADQLLVANDKAAVAADKVVIEGYKNTALAAASQNLSAISQTKAGTVVACFVYDTSKDSDGGAWPKRCQHTSWYNETLNTTTRGATRDAPAAIGIALEAGKLTLYDMADVNMPMWMVFNNTAFGPIYGSTGHSCVVAVNGEIWVGHNNGNGVTVIDLANDICYRILTTGSFVSNVGSSISLRNTAGTGYAALSALAIVNNNVNALAVTVLNDAPIDNDTRLLMPTVYAYTLAGVSRLAHDGTVTNWTESGSVDDVTSGHVIGDYVYFVTDSSLGKSNVLAFRKDAALSATLYNATNARRYSGKTVDTWSANLTVIDYGGIDTLINNIAYKAFATNRGLAFFEPNTSNLGNGLYALIGKDFNAGFIGGDCRGAYLCNSVAETLTAANLVTNDSSTFTAGVGSWTAGSFDASIAAVGGKMEVTSLAGSGAAAPGASLSITCVVGKNYVLSASVEKISGRANAVIQIDSAGSPSVIVSVTGTNTITMSFVATSTTHNVYVFENAVSEASGLALRVDNVTVKLADPDVSYRNQALTVVGSITKSTVNTGCELMGYSGFNVSNYFLRANNADLALLTNDFHISFWVKKSAISGDYECVMSNGLASNRLMIAFLPGSSTILFQTSDSTPIYSTAASSASVALNIWTKIDAVRLSSGVKNIYINGMLDSSTSQPIRSLSNTSASLYVGCYIPGTYIGYNLNLSQLKISGVVPTGKQIKFAYDKERHLFNAGTKCLLAGTTNDCKAVDYDEFDDSHHVVTGDYYSKFKGLVRVDQAAGAWTSVAAESGFVVRGN